MLLLQDKLQLLAPEARLQSLSPAGFTLWSPEELWSLTLRSGAGTPLSARWTSVWDTPFAEAEREVHLCDWSVLTYFQKRRQRYELERFVLD